MKSLTPHTIHLINGERILVDSLMVDAHEAAVVGSRNGKKIGALIPAHAISFFELDADALKSRFSEPVKLHVARCES